MNIPFLFFCLVSGAIVDGAQLGLEVGLMAVVDLWGRKKFLGMYRSWRWLG